MKKISTYLLLSILTVFIAKAQDAKIDWGNSQYKDGTNEYRPYLIGTKENNYFFFSYNAKDEIVIEKYNFAHEMVDEIKVNYSINKKRPNNETTLITDSNIVFFAYIYSKWSQYKILYATSFTFDGKVEKDWTEVARIESKYSKHLGKFKVQLTPDKKNFLIEIDEPYEDFATKQFRFKVINTSLETIWEKKIELGQQSQNVSLCNYLIDNNANLVFTAKIKNEMRGRKNLPKFSYKLMQYDYKKDKLDQYNIKPESFIISDVALNINKDNKIILLGFYSKKDDFLMGGIFYDRINRTTMESENFYQTPFSETVLKQYLGDADILKGEEIPAFRRLKIVPKENGGLIFLSESVQYRQHVNSERQVVSKFEFGNIMAINIKPDETIEWVSTINKYQFAGHETSFYTSYTHHLNGDNIYFIFNANERKEGSLLYDQFLKVVKVDGTGQISEEKFYEKVNEKKGIAYLIIPCTGQISKEKTIIFLDKFRFFRIGTLILK